jgi:hypothetical protein
MAAAQAIMAAAVAAVPVEKPQRRLLAFSRSAGSIQGAPPSGAGASRGAPGPEEPLVSDAGGREPGKVSSFKDVLDMMRIFEVLSAVAWLPD